MRWTRIRLVSYHTTAGLAFVAANWAAPAQACSLCSCTASVSPVSFGAYDPTAMSPRDGSGLVSVDCTGIVSLFGTVEVTASPGSSGNALQRTMKRGSATLNYNLYANVARTSVFGNGLNGTMTLSSSMTGLLLFSTSMPFYARVPAGQWVGSGTYSDTVVVTVSY